MMKTIESMARYMPDNEILELTDQQLGYQPVVWGLDREPLSVEIMTRMSRLPDGVGPLNLALRENLPLDIVMTLAKRDWDMIIQKLYKDAWLLPESIIDGYIRSEDPLFVRSVLEDNSPTIRQCSWRTIHQTMLSQD